MEVNSGRFDGRANLKPWKPGQSGNSAGKPIGTRQAFSQGFIKDFSTVWQEEGLEVIGLGAENLFGRLKGHFFCFLLLGVGLGTTTNIG